MGIGFSTRLKKLEKRAALYSNGMKNDTPSLEIITALDWETLESRRAKSKVVKMYKVLNDSAPNALVNHFTRQSNLTSLQIPFPKS